MSDYDKFHGGKKGGGKGTSTFQGEKSSGKSEEPKCKLPGEKAS